MKSEQQRIGVNSLAHTAGIVAGVVVYAVMALALASGVQAQTVDFWFSLKGSQVPITDNHLIQGQTLDISLWYKTDASFAHNVLEALVGYDRTDTKGNLAFPKDNQIALIGSPIINMNAFDYVLMNDIGGGYSATGGIRPYGAHLVISKLRGTVTAYTPQKIADFTICNVGVPDGGSYALTVDGPTGANWTSAIAQGSTIWYDPTCALLTIHSRSIPSVPISDVKLQANEVYVSCAGKIVTAVFGNDLYVEEPDRSAGIRVTKRDHGAQVGNTVNVTGLMTTDAVTGERFIDSTNGSIYASKGTELQPVAMSNKSLGGGDFGIPPNGQRGVSGGVGLNTIGLLVRTTGKVIRIDSSNFTINDGSEVTVKVTCPAGTAPQTGEFAAVTGINSCESAGGARLVKARTISDIKVISH